MKTRLLRRRHEPPAHPVLRLVRIVLGFLVIVVGIILAIPGVPGPGVVIVFFGLWLVSADVRLARRALIRLRIWFRKGARKYRLWRDGKPHPH